jgi:senataxin
MNVALTRARASLFVLGHCPTLERSDKTWKDIISDARERGCLIEVSASETRTRVLERDLSLQADVDLFMGRKEKAPPKSTTKPQKKAAVNSQPIPTTLVAARSIGSQGTTTPTSVQRSNAPPSEPLSTPLPPVLIPTRSLSSSQLPATSPGVSLPKPAAQPSETKSSQRPPPAPGESSAGAGSGPKSTQNIRPAPLPKQRPKQPPSLFIPKKVRV